MNKKLLGILVCTLLIATAFSVNGCVELNDIKSNISIDKGIASSSTTTDYKSFFNRHKEGESNILNRNENWQWAKGAGGTSEDAGQGIVTLSDGSTIVTGYFSGSATFGKGENSETSLVSDGSTDIFLAKHNWDGTIAWVKRAGGTSKDVGRGIVLLSDDSTIVTGSFGGSATWGKGENSESVLVSDGSDDIFLAKHNWDGTIAWVKRAGGTSKDVGRGIVLLSDDSTIVTGSFGGSATWGKGENSESVLVSDGSDDIFLAKHNWDGTIAWVKRAGGTSEDAGQGIVTLSDGSTIVTGYFSGIADFGPYTLTSQSQRYSDVFVAKLSDDGGNQPPNKPSTPSGPASGKTGTQYGYSSNTIDSDGDDVFYMFDWGDGTNSGWLGPYISGDTVNAFKTWTAQGSYSVKVKAMDSNLEEGPWSDPLAISMPKNKATNTPFLQFLENHPHLFPLLRQLMEL